MGLDMYLYDQLPGKEYKEEVAYWRKANQIHKWFVDNVQDGVDDCGYYHVSKDDLQSLVDTCKKVLSIAETVDGEVKNGEVFTAAEGWKAIMKPGKVVTNPQALHEILPSKGGFFFGGTDYDEYYLDKVKRTIEMLEPLIASENSVFYYHSSW